MKKLDEISFLILPYYGKPELKLFYILQSNVFTDNIFNETWCTYGRCKRLK